MFRLLKLLSHRLDLDEEWVASQEFQKIMPGNLQSFGRHLDQQTDEYTYLAWIAPVLWHSLNSGATAFHLLRDHQDNCLRQLIWVPYDEQGEWTQFKEQMDPYEWSELVPMNWTRIDTGIKVVRMIATMMPWSKRGVIHYRYKGKWARARCVQESKDDLVIYFAEDRPAIRHLPTEPLATG